MLLNLIALVFGIAIGAVLGRNVMRAIWRRA